MRHKKKEIEIQNVEFHTFDRAGVLAELKRRREENIEYDICKKLIFAISDEFNRPNLRNEWVDFINCNPDKYKTFIDGTIFFIKEKIKFFIVPKN